MSARAVLLDLDGTILDTGPLILETLRRVLKVELGLEPDDQELARQMGKTLSQTFAAFGAGEAQITRMIQRYRQLNIELHDTMVRPFPGAAGAIAALRARGLRLGIVTTKRRETALRGLALAGLAGAFDTLVANEDVRAHKPDPEGVRLAMGRLGVLSGPVSAAGGEPGGSGPPPALMVGDTPVDVAAARRAGLPAAVVSWSLVPSPLIEASRPNWVLNSWDDLLRVVDRPLPLPRLP